MMFTDKNPTDRDLFIDKNVTCQCKHSSECFISEGCLSCGFSLSHRLFV